MSICCIADLIKWETLKWRDCLGFFGWATCKHKDPCIWKRKEGESGLERDSMRKCQLANVSFENTATECRQLPGARKGMSPEGAPPCSQLDFRPMSPFQTSHLQNSKINLSCLNSLFEVICFGSNRTLIHCLLLYFKLLKWWWFSRFILAWLLRFCRTRKTWKCITYIM